MMRRFMEHVKTDIKSLYVLIIISGVFAAMVIGFVHTRTYYERIRMLSYAAMVIMVLLVSAVTVWDIFKLYKNGNADIEAVCRFVIFSGAIIRVIYITFTSIEMRQNDVLSIFETGHIGYILHVMEHGVPPVPGTGWEYTQPPLWYYITAAWAKMFSLFREDIYKILESIQMISLICSVGLVIVCDRIAAYLKLSDKMRLASDLLFAFYPYMIFTAGAINNDILSFLLSMLVILYGLKWSESKLFKDLMLIAVFFGTALLTKFGAILIGPALAILFLMVFFREQKTTRAFGEYCIFAVVSSALGLTWPIFSKVVYGVPIGYINSASEAHKGNHEIWEMLFSFKNQLNHYYLCVIEDDVYSDFNIFSTVVKAGTYGPDNFMSDNPILRVIGIVLLWINICLAVFLVVTSFIWIIKSRLKPEIRAFLGVTVWGSVLSLYLRAFYSRYTCNMELRFMLPAFLVMILTAGQLLTDSESRHKEKYANVYLGASLAITYLSICMWFIVLTIRDYSTIQIKIY